MSDVVAIIVTFNPSIEALEEQLKCIEPDCAAIIVDSGSAAELVAALRQLFTAYGAVELLELDRNYGIAYAQNRGVELGQTQFPNAPYRLFLDQDSLPSSTMVATLRANLDTLAAHGQAAIGPNLQDSISGSLTGFHQMNRWRWLRLQLPVGSGAVVEVAGLNSSGLFVHKNTLLTVGAFDESLFIDHVDTEWSFKARFAGVKLFGVADAVMRHAMGENTINYWFFGPREMPYREPNRHYYLFRNSILLQRRRYVPVVWKLWNVFKLILTCGFFCTCTRERSAQFKQMLRGFRDGLFPK